MIDLSKQALNKEQVEVLRGLKVPLYHHFNTDTWFIATGYWHSIKPALQEALVRVLS